MTFAQALRCASSLYLKNLIPLGSMYLLLMAIPIVLQAHFLDTYASTDFARTDNAPKALRALVATVPASDPHYIAWAFAKMLGALVAPFALASLILGIKHLIQCGKPRLRECASLIGRKWLTIAQFGVLMHIIWSLVNDGVGALHDLSNGTIVVELVVLIVLFTMLNFGYAAALVVITLDRVDPIRGLCFGIWFGSRYLFGSLGRFVLLTGLAIVACSFYLLAVKSTSLGNASTFAFVSGFCVFSSWIYFAMVLFVLGRIVHENAVPRWLRAEH